MTPEGLRGVLEQVWGHVFPPWYVYMLFLLLCVPASALGAWLGAYGREKGKNYATTEDLNRLVDQARQTTKAIEDVRAQISGALWVEQNRWGFKRDAYVRLLVGLNEVQTAIDEYLSVKKSWESEQDAERKERARKIMMKLFGRFEKAVIEMRRELAPAQIMLSEEGVAAVREFGSSWVTAARELDSSDALLRQKAAAVKAINLLVPAAQRDLLALTVSGPESAPPPIATPRRPT